MSHGTVDREGRPLLLLRLYCVYRPGMSILGRLLAADNELRLSRAESDAISEKPGRGTTPDQLTTQYRRRELDRRQ